MSIAEPRNMTLLLDTSAVIGWLERKDRGVIDQIGRHTTVPAVSVVSLGELERGVEHATDQHVRAIRRIHTDFVATRLEVSGIDRATAVAWAAFARRLPRSLGHNDIWIVATAAVTGRTLLTQDELLADVVRQLTTSEIDRPGVTPPTVELCPVG